MCKFHQEQQSKDQSIKSVQSINRKNRYPSKPVIMIPSLMLILLILTLSTITIAAPPIVTSETEGTRIIGTEGKDDDSSGSISVTTPEVPYHFECEDEGFFVNPKDCRKYFWCLDSKPANLGIVAHAFTCPSGLYFNPKTEACDYPDNVTCKQAKKNRSEIEKKKKNSRGASSDTNGNRRNRNKVTTTTSTTTEAPTTIPTLPTSTTPIITPELLAAALRLNERAQTTPVSKPKNDNLYQLLQLVQSLGGVDRLKSLLGSNEMDTISDRNESGNTRTFIRVNSRDSSITKPSFDSESSTGNNGRRPTLHTNHGNGVVVDTLNNNEGHIPSYSEPMRRKQSVRVRPESAWPALPSPPSLPPPPPGSPQSEGFSSHYQSSRHVGGEMNIQLVPLHHSVSGPRKVTRIIEVTTEAPHALSCKSSCLSFKSSNKYR